MFVTIKGSRKVAYLDEEAFVQYFVGEVFQHQTEQLVLWKTVVKIFTCTEELASLDDGGREEACASADNCLKLGNWRSVDESDYQYRRIARSLSVYLE
jgi:hypothetical protein